MAEASSSSVHGKLSPQNALKIVKYHLDNARKTTDPDLAEMLYNESRAALSRMAHPTLEVLLNPDYTQNLSLKQEITSALTELDELLACLKPPCVTQENQTEAESLSNTQTDDGLHPSQSSVVVDTAVIPRHIFAVNRCPPAMKFRLPECGGHIANIPQLAYCLELLRTWRSSPDAILDPTARNWLQVIDQDKDEINRIKALAADVITTFTREGVKDIEFIEEVVRLAPVVEKPVYRYLLAQLCDQIERSNDLDPRQLECLALMIRGASTGYLEAADVIKILELLVNRPTDVHQEQLALSVSRVVDAIADTSIEGLDNEELLRPMSVYLDSLKATSDPRLAYQAAYIYQALQHIPDSQPIWHAVLRHSPIELLDNIKVIDVKEILQQFHDIHQGSGLGCSQGDNGKSLLDCLKDGSSFESKQSWYAALRTADALFWSGQFAEFKKFAYEAACRRNPAFQWGLCQLLGDHAASLEWDTRTRLSTVAFLEDIYRNDAVWGEQADIKELVISILTQLASLPESVKQAANTILHQLTTGNIPTEQHIEQAFHGAGLRRHPSNVSFPSSAALSLLDHVQDTLGVEVGLHRLRKQHLTPLQDAVYVEPRAKATLQSHDLSRFSLMDSIKEFLRGDKRVFLLLGNSGSGKSVFCRTLERYLWNMYEIMESPIPLYVDMSTITQSGKDLIGSCLLRLGFKHCQIQELKTHRKFILICDEYDSTSPSENLYAINKLNQSGGWHAKVIVCCRNDHLGSTSLDYFYPTDENSQVHPELFQQAVIEPFNVDQVHDYLKQYVSLQTPHWEMDDYLRVFEQNHCLQDQLRNPLLLSLTLEVLPRLVDSQHVLSSKKFSKLEIYDQILVYWFELSKVRLRGSNPTGTDMERFICGNFIQSGLDYLKRLAAAIYKNQDGAPIVEYSHLYSCFKRDEAWKEDFFGQGGLNQVLCEASPLKRCGNKFLFIHPSFLEYGLSLAVHDPQEFKRVTTSKPLLTRRGSMDSVMSFESNDTDDDATTTIEHGHEQESPLIWKNLVNDHSILEFLEDRVHQEPLFKQKLLAIIEFSKTEKRWRTAAANSITILVGAGISFKGADLQGIQIPGANLSRGSFESAQLQGADLRKTTLLNTRLSKANLTQAQMKGVQFGEFPPIEVGGAVHCCAYSPDGKYVAVGLYDGCIGVYSTSSWERIKTLETHSNLVNDVSFSARGQIISGSSDKMVRLWDAETGNCLKTLAGHTEDVHAVAFSPQRDQVAFASGDRSIRLWNVSRGTCQLLSGHTETVYSVMFSPNDCQLASGSSDNTVRIWDLEAGALHSTLSGHDDSVYSIAYSPQGHLIASGSGDKSVRLWNVESGTCQSILRGHLGDVRSVAFSPLGNLVASGSIDNSVRLWDVETGSCRNILSEHNGAVMAVVFSPKGDHIVSAGEDRTIRLWNVGAGNCHYRSHGRDEPVRNIFTSPSCTFVATPHGNNVQLWDLNTGNCIKTLVGHSKPISSVVISPTCTQIASGSHDNTVRLWDMKSGACLHALRGHGQSVSSIAFSPTGNHIASGSADRTVRVWEVDNGQCAQILSGHTSLITGVAYSPTADQIASSSYDRTVRLWDVKTRSCILILPTPFGTEYSVAFSPKGDFIASGGGDATVRLWDAKSGACRHFLRGHNYWVQKIAFSPNGDQLASSDARSVRLWSVDLGACLDRSFESVTVLEWRTKSDQDYLVAGRMDKLQLCWIPAHRCDLTDATLLGVHGLSEVDKRLLIQRGATDVPAFTSSALNYCARI